MKIKTTTYRTERKSKRDYRVRIGLSITLPDDSILNTSAIIQLNPLAYLYGKSPDITFGMLYLSAIVYAIDRAVERNRFSIDGWSREFEVDICIPEFEMFRSVEPQINEMLSFLTGDYWECHFVGSATVKYPRYRITDRLDGISQVNLFSGGMDSLIGAIDYMEENPSGKLFLASHYDSFMKGPSSDQSAIIKQFYRKYDGRFLSMGPVMITPEISLELSCRSRSLMFISIALVVAEYARCNVGVPENGSVSLNYPLSSSRRASCSTRTTHPIFLRQLNNIISSVGISATVFNRYEKQTKGEMVRTCANKSYLCEIVASSNSCGKRSLHQSMHDNRTATHCGFCMPCMYRRAALLGENDPTTYGNSFATLFDNRGTKLSEDFFAMLNFLKKDLSREDIRRELLIAGMCGFEDLGEFVDLVVRTREELANMVYADGCADVISFMNK